MTRTKDFRKTGPNRTTKVALWLALAVVLVLMLFLSPLAKWAARGAEAGPPPTPSVKDGLQAVGVYLRAQPQIAIAEEVNAEFAPTLQRLSEQAEAADRALRPMDKLPSWMSTDDEMAYVQRLAQERPINAQAEQAHQRAIASLEDTRDEMGREIVARSAAAQARSQAEAAKVVEELGGQVIYRYHTVNGLAVLIPPDQVKTLSARLGNVPVFEDRILHGSLNNSAAAIQAPDWWTAFNPGGFWDIGIIDSGVDADHPALHPHGVVRGRFLNFAEWREPRVGEWEPDLTDVGVVDIADRSGHGTHVAGIVSSRDATYKGIAYRHRYIISGKAAYAPYGEDGSRAVMYAFDAMDATEWALDFAEPYRADVLNLSYGHSAVQDDDDYMRFWDALVDQRNVFVAMSAGNLTEDELPSLDSPGIAYNVVCVANIDDRNTSDRGDDVIAFDSKRGPTPGGRKKPDVAAPGTDIASCDNSWRDGDDFISMSGTSMAAPHVAGAAMLMLSRNFIDPMAMKALLINSARDAGLAGWDAAYGWGIINLSHLGTHFYDRFFDRAELGGSHYYTGIGRTGDKATLVWNRRATCDPTDCQPTVYGLTNLNLYLYDQATDAEITSSTSNRDNVEQVVWWAAPDGLRSVVRVACNVSPILGRNDEPYVLATEQGFERRTGPVTFPAPMYMRGNPFGPPGSIIVLSAAIVNQGDLPAHNIALSLNYGKELNLIKGDAYIPIGTLLAGDSSPTYYWELTKLTAARPQVTLTTQSDSYGEPSSITKAFSSSAVYLPLILK